MMLQVVANVVSYARAVVSAGGSSARSCRLVVSPALLEVSEGAGGHTAGRPASLGLLVMTTRNLAAQLARTQVCSLFPFKYRYLNFYTICFQGCTGNIVTILTFHQCFGFGSRSGSGLDPDSIRSLDPDPDSESGSGSRGKKVRKILN